MNPAWIAAALTAAGAVALFVFAPKASAVELSAERPWLLWSVEPGERAMPRLRGTYTVRTACDLDLASLAMVSTRATRLSCVKMEEKR